MAANTQTQSRFMNLKLKRPSVNPILIKELRGRMRGPRAFAILTGFLLLLSAVAFLLYKTSEEAFRYGYGMSGTSAMMGVSIFMGLAFFELFLVAFITPALTAGTISGEQEALTYEMLVATPLRASSIMIGKVTAALFYVFLLIFAAVPMLSLVFIFGGVTLPDMWKALLVLATCAVSFGMVGMFWSALLRRTGRATVMSYLTLLTFIIGPYLIFAVWGVMKHQQPPAGLLYPNPFTALVSVINIGPDQGMLFNGPFYMLFGLLGGGMQWGGPPIAWNHPAWHWTIALYSLLTLVLALLTMCLVRPIGQRRPTLLQAVGGVALVALLLLGYSRVFTAEDWAQITVSPDVLWQQQQGGPDGKPMPVEPFIEPGIQVDPALIDPIDEPEPIPTVPPEG